MEQTPFEATGAPGAAITLDEKQIRCLGSSLRREVLMTLGSIGPASVGDVAAALDRPADALYYHIRHLVRVGLVRDLGKRPASTRSESVYVATGRLVRTDLSKRSPRYLAALKRMFASTLRTLARRIEAALDDPGLTRGGPARQLTLRTQLVRLDDLSLVELNRRLDALTEFVGSRSLEHGGDLYEVLVAATVVDHGGRPRG